MSGRRDDVKRRLRKLKQMEARLRPGASLAWDGFFDLHERPLGRARFSLGILAVMDEETLQGIIEDYFAHLFYQMNQAAYDPDDLARMGLPAYAGEEEIKSRFRELSKQYHPDAGGDAHRFIQMMEVYRKLIGRG